MTEPLVNAGHADQDHREVGAVVLVAERLKSGGSQPFGFVDDEQLAHGFRIRMLFGTRFAPERARAVMPAVSTP